MEENTSTKLLPGQELISVSLTYNPLWYFFPACPSLWKEDTLPSLRLAMLTFSLPLEHSMSMEALCERLQRDP